MNHGKTMRADLVEIKRPAAAHCDMCQLYEAQLALKNAEIENGLVHIGLQREEIRTLDRRIGVLYLALLAVALFALWLVKNG